ncbi:energy-coupled thiamine transporter ThiT [Acholeplasma sp. OttesenSCG-928-E16]|nr:energy-coupled thiamine transporter ThiT [Acholeplasma sp. OttesenSCG-928-E16]
MNKRRENLRKLTLTALFAAVAVVLELIITFVPGLNLEMPFGGRVFGISMLPIIILSFLCGIGYGLTGGFILASVNVLSNLNLIVTWGLTPAALAGTIILDYMVPFTLLGLAGVVKSGKNPKIELLLGTLLVCGIRYVCHCVSGLVVFGELAPEGMNVWFYSLIAYNLPYMASSTALCVVVGMFIIKPISRYYYQLIDQQSSDNQDEDLN